MKPKFKSKNSRYRRVFFLSKTCLKTFNRYDYVINSAAKQLGFLIRNTKSFNNIQTLCFITH